MINGLRSIKDVDVYKKKVFLRVDLDVPIKNNKIEDTLRLEAWLPTLEYLLKNQAEVIVAGHLGRPKQQFTISGFQFPKENEGFSLRPVAEWLMKQLELHHELKEIDFEGFKAFEITGNVILLENLRFYKEEEENDSVFSKKLASLAQIYVNDAFASSHRAHASIVGITKFIPHYCGFRLLEEVKVMSQILKNPERPLVVIIGGAKIETKLPLVEKMHHFADYVLVGGEIAENDRVLLKVQHERINPPPGGKKSILLVADVTGDRKDITEKSAENFLQICQPAGTIVWNGPMGLVEEKESQKGTEILADGIIKLNSYRVVGGGDTLGFLKSKNVLNKFSFVSTGGGAMLEFLAGLSLPGIAALKSK